MKHNNKDGRALREDLKCFVARPGDSDVISSFSLWWELVKRPFPDEEQLMFPLDILKKRIQGSD